MKEESPMKQHSAPHIIEYPGKAALPFTRARLSTRLHILIVDAQQDFAPCIAAALQTDTMLTITPCAHLPSDLSRYDLALVYLDSAGGEAPYMLQSLARHVPHRILICQTLTSEIAKLAVHFKVDNLLTCDDLAEQLYSALASVAEAVHKSLLIAPQTTVINGKAGSGASFVTCCMSEVFSARFDKKLALIDADFNYGSLSHGLGMQHHYSIAQALDELDKLDDAAIRSMMSRRDNVHLLGNTPFSRLQQTEEASNQMDQLDWKVRQAFDEVLVDMSKGLEVQTLALLRQSTTILIVMQLNVAALRETQAMLTALQTHVDIRDKKIAIIVNRYDGGRSEIQLKDVQTVLGVDTLFTISNNFPLARLRTDLGRPLSTLANHKVIYKEIAQIVHFVSGTPDSHAGNEKPGFFARLLRTKQ